MFSEVYAPFAKMARTLEAPELGLHGYSHALLQNEGLKYTLPKNQSVSYLFFLK